MTNLTIAPEPRSHEFYTFDKGLLACQDYAHSKLLTCNKAKAKRIFKGGMGVWVHLSDPPPPFPGMIKNPHKVLWCPCQLGAYQKSGQN